jgi:hypothetical protein
MKYRSRRELPRTLLTDLKTKRSLTPSSNPMELCYDYGGLIEMVALGLDQGLLS